MKGITGALNVDKGKHNQTDWFDAIHYNSSNNNTTYMNNLTLHLYCKSHSPIIGLFTLFYYFEQHSHCFLVNKHSFLRMYNMYSLRSHEKTTRH